MIRTRTRIVFAAAAVFGLIGKGKLASPASTLPEHRA